MRGFRFVWALSVLLIARAECEEAVYFADVKLKTAVENALGIPDPTPTDMLDLIELNLSGDINRQDSGLKTLPASNMRPTCSR
jgi:hypothetical protein